LLDTKSSFNPFLVKSVRSLIIGIKWSLVAQFGMDNRHR